MRAFRDQPLARKAITLGVVPTVCAVTILFVMTITATYFRAQRNTKLDLEAQAATVADYVKPALMAGKSEAAEATLRLLRPRRNIAAICVFDSGGELFASYAQGNRECEPTLSTRTVDQRLLLSDQPVKAATGDLGTVRIEGSLSPFYEWARALLPGIVGALAIGSLIAFALTRRLQRVISGPVLDLARTADAVSANRDYSLRAVKQTDDEVGGLVQSFNAMLDEIQRQNQLLTTEIAERKRAEELKDAFLAAVSHELRTPLNAILGRLQLLRDTNPGPSQIARALESLERNARSQARLVEDLLDVSRMVSGTFQMHFDVVDLRTVVSAAIDALMPQAITKAIPIAATIPSTPCLVSGDSGRLQQALMNLLSNAIKFSSKGTVTVDLSTVRGTCEYAISVHDAGIGIDPEFLPKVFDRFRQGDESMTRQHSGLGLGLAIVKEVAELHGGSVVAASGGMDRGARFTIRLPQLIETEPAMPAVDRLRPTAQSSNTALQGLRVLVVDDEADGLEIASTALATAGATVASASSGREAIAQWRQGSFDALVCDLAMPDIDGFQVLDRIVDLDHQAGRTPIAVALTAYASNTYRHRSLAAGFHVHLAKPCNPRDLVKALGDIVRMRTQRAAEPRRVHAESR